MERWRVVLGAMVIIASMVGCGGDDDGYVAGDAGTGSDAGTGADAGGDEEGDAGVAADAGADEVDASVGADAGSEPEMVSFAELRAGLATCLGCHNGDGRAGFTLSGNDDQVYAELVSESRLSGRPCGSLGVRVVADEPSMSVLYLKTHGTDCGNQMIATPAQQQLIEDWIRAGAPGPE